MRNSAATVGCRGLLPANWGPWTGRLDYLKPGSREVSFVVICRCSVCQGTNMRSTLLCRVRPYRFSQFVI